MTERVIPTNATYNVATSKVFSDGKDITNSYTILSIAVSRVVNRVPLATLKLRDGSPAEEKFAASEGADIIPGKQLEIAMGYDSKDQSIFKGVSVKQTIKVAADGDSLLMVECRGVVAKLTIGRHSRYFQDSKDSDAIGSIIGRYKGLSAAVEDTDVQHAELVQHYVTDWDFILSRAEMNGRIVLAEDLAEDSVLKVKRPATQGKPLITLTYGANLLGFEAEMDARCQYPSVKAQAWSYTNQGLVETEAVEPSVNAQGNLSGETLAQAMALPAWELRHGGWVAEQELQVWADAQLLKSRLAKIQARVTMDGYPAAKPDAVIKLAGVGQRFNGLAYVSGIRHEVNGGAWTTHMQLGLDSKWFYKEPDIVEKPAAGLLPGVNGLQIGVVVQLEGDPDGEDRILVKSTIVGFE